MISLKSSMINTEITSRTFNALGIDESGLSETEIRILKTLYEADRPVGLETLSIITNESSKTIKNDLEPYLMQMGFMIRSGVGRTITPAGREYLENRGRLEFQKVEISADYIRK